ncbi:hypothetical protein DL96DRAFT_478804 [Flagelloscypha sp. PMI_526]|nr:hypothetical protein DL96DRAFT_478804 [Flagelloscypha sp. PMI_526]
MLSTSHGSNTRANWSLRHYSVFLSQSDGKGMVEGNVGHYERAEVLLDDVQRWIPLKRANVKAKLFEWSWNKGSEVGRRVGKVIQDIVNHVRSVSSMYTCSLASLHIAMEVGKEAKSGLLRATIPSASQASVSFIICLGRSILLNISASSRFSRKTPQIKLTMMHGDLLVFERGSLEWFGQKTGATFLLSGVLELPSLKAQVPEA